MKRFLFAAALGLCPAAAPAHEGAKPAAPGAVDYSAYEETAFGRAADPRKARRTVRIEMSDHMRFSPAQITVRRGDTVRFLPINKGEAMHEMVLGTLEGLKAHAELMRKHPGMEHDEPHMAHVPPGRTGEIGWQFTRAGEFFFGCLVPGHFEAGMVGRIRVMP